MRIESRARASARLEVELQRELASSATAREGRDLADYVLGRLVRLFERDEGRVRAYLDTPQPTWGQQTPADLTRRHGYDTLDHLLDQVERGRRF